MSLRPLIKECVILLNVFGLSSLTVGFLTKIKITIALFILILSFLNSLLECIIHFDGLNSVGVMTITVGIYQVLIKSCMLLIYHKDISMLFDKMNKFWNIDKYGLEVESEIRAIYNLAKQMMKLMIAMITIVVSGFFFQSVFGKSRTLPFKGFYPQDLTKSVDYQLAFLFQMLMIVVGCPVLLGFDGLLISLIIHIICELKLLKKGFENVPIDVKTKNDTRDAMVELCKMVDHHNLILECINIMRKVYSILLLNVYLFNIACICGGLLGMIVDGLPPTVASLSKYGMFAVFYVIQLFFYCATGNYLTTECQSISNTIYDTKWWIKTQPELRRAYVLIILRTSKLEELTAGGMFSLSLTSFRKVLRTALSFLTLVEAVYKDEVVL